MNIEAMSIDPALTNSFFFLDSFICQQESWIVSCSQCSNRTLGVRKKFFSSSLMFVSPITSGSAPYRGKFTTCIFSSWATLVRSKVKILACIYISASSTSFLTFPPNFGSSSLAFPSCCFSSSRLCFSSSRLCFSASLFFLANWFQQGWIPPESSANDFLTWPFKYMKTLGRSCPSSARLFFKCAWTGIIFSWASNFMRKKTSMVTMPAVSELLKLVRSRRFDLSASFIFRYTVWRV